MAPAVHRFYGLPEPAEQPGLPLGSEVSRRPLSDVRVGTELGAGGPSLDLLLTYNGRTPASRKAEIDRESLKRLFAAVVERYVACDGTVVNDGG